MTEEKATAVSHRVLAANTIAFTVCFAAWMMNGVLVTWLVENAVFRFSKTEIGWLIGIPVLTGSIFRLPVGILTDRYGGRPVYTLLMLFAAASLFATAHADSFAEFMIAGLAFGTAGASFAIGVAYTSVWFPKARQGTALGIFGAGNVGTALTTMGAPILLRWLTNDGENPEAWRHLPRIYGAALLATAVLFWFATVNRRPEGSKTLSQRLAPLRHLRVWRFGLYYSFTFGGFVALTQWLVPYYVNAYTLSVATAGLMATTFNLPASLIRALGGWMSDRWGARSVMYGILGTALVCSVLLFFPRMTVETPGAGVTAPRSGTVESVSPEEVVLSTRTGTLRFPVRAGDDPPIPENGEILVLPTMSSRQEAVVRPGEQVSRNQLLVRGTTRIFFQANVWIFSSIVFVLGLAMGIGNAAVYKHIPTYFPDDVGTVGGLVGVIGGLGGFVCPILFGYLLAWTGLWTTCWYFFAALVVVCFVWMHLVVRRVMKEKAPALVRQMDEAHVD